MVFSLKRLIKLSISKIRNLNCDTLKSHTLVPICPSEYVKFLRQLKFLFSFTSQEGAFVQILQWLVYFDIEIGLDSK